jgi:hypothetical protein
MVAERDGTLEIVVDGPGDAHHLHAEPFVNRPSPAKTPVSSQNHQRGVLQERRGVLDRRRADLFF